MDLGIAGKVALVTAGSKGLGRASALALAQNGARVCISARNDADVQEAAKFIGKATGRPDDILALVADVTKQEDLDRVFKAVLGKWGQCDILVANCGGPKVGTFMQLKPEDWVEASNLTMMSFVRACYTVVPHMIERKTGSIVTIQSFTVKQGIDNLVLSNSVRLANIGLARSLATELGPHGIRVNSINPGQHMTDRLMSNLEKTAKSQGVSKEQFMRTAAGGTPLQKINSPENFGENVAWLASPAAGFITGQAIMVDGGAVRSSL